MKSLNEIFPNVITFLEGIRSTYYSSGKSKLHKVTIWRVSYSDTIYEAFFFFFLSPDLLHLNASSSLHQTWKTPSVATDGFVALAQINFIEKIKARSVDHASLLWRQGKKNKIIQWSSIRSKTLRHRFILLVSPGRQSGEENNETWDVRMPITRAYSELFTFNCSQ